MASKIPDFQEKTRDLINSKSSHLDCDEDFAFATGQLIYYLISLSESSSKTHSLLESFISKSDFNQFILMVTKCINQYKHAINFGNRRFEKLASEVLGYKPTISNLKLLQPILLSGYFSESLIYEHNTESIKGDMK